MPQRRGGGGDKKAQFYQAIVDQKLDRVRWGVANAGVAPATRREEDGMTMYMIAAAAGKDRSLAEMIRFHERRVGQLRECLTQTHDETGQTCMHMACGHPQGSKCVSELLDAWLRVSPKNREAWNTAKDGSGKRPSDLAKGKTAAVLEEWLAEDEEDEEDDATAEADDGLTSTQRSKLKKKALEASERAGAVVAKSVAEAEVTSAEVTSAAPDGGSGSDGGADAGSMPEPHWPEVEAWALAVKNLRPIYELSARRDADDSDAPLPVFDAFGAPSVIDPALWWCTSLNRLELKLGPRLTALPPQLARLNNLTTLIVAGNGLDALPDCVGDLPLKSLDASKNRLTSLPPSMPAATLEALDLSQNDLDDLAPLSACENLVSLALDRNPRLASLAPLPFAGLKRLVSLSASHAALASLDPGLGALAKLETLVLSNNPFTELPPALAACKKLKHIQVDNTAITDNKVLGYISKGEIKQLGKYWEKNAGSKNKGGGKKGKR